MNEDRRYKFIQEQIRNLHNQAANDRNSGGMIGLGAVWVSAEMFVANERAHERHKQRRKKKHE